MLKEIKLPVPEVSGDTTIEENIAKRRSIRPYSNTSLSLKDVSPLLWAAQGIPSNIGFRTASSAGTLHLLEAYLVAGQTDG